MLVVDNGGAAGDPVLGKFGVLGPAAGVGVERRRVSNIKARL